jgi:hypothetical protein
MQNIVFIDAETHEVLGAMPAPECFAPNDLFVADAARIGITPVFLTDDEFRPVLDAVCDAGGAPEMLVLNAVMLLSAMRAAADSVSPGFVVHGDPNKAHLN